MPPTLTPSLAGAQADKLASFIRQGRVILFTGAGFSLDAKTTGGDPVPSPQRLAEALWEIAFPGVEFDGSSLGDVYEAARMQAGRKTRAKMRELLTVDPGSLPDCYRLWFSFPWHRVYTVNVDDLDEAAGQAFDLPRPLHPISALSEPAPTPEYDALQVIHLNGTLEDLPDVTFSFRQYGERLGKPDLWYANLARELKVHPVLYVGTSLDEPPLWTYVEERGSRRTQREIRPGSFLVSPQLDRARSVALSGYNVFWVKMTAAEFAGRVLPRLSDEAESGIREIEYRRRSERGGPPVSRVSELQHDSQKDEREFLLGREPRWSDFDDEGFAVTRDFDVKLAELYSESSARLLVITGTAGVGKSTSAMRLALERAAEGDDVYVMNADTSVPLKRLRQAIADADADLLLIDGVDRFGPSTPGFLQEVLEDCPDLRIVGCVRSTRIQALEGLAGLGVDSVEETVPRLEDADVEALLDALDAANRLGELKGKTRKQQREAMQKTYGRQLLVALLEVTQGVRLEQKIESECRQLEGDAPLVYSVAALASFAGGPLSDQELVAAAGDAPTAVEQIRLLLRRHLLIRTGSQRLMPRHGMIASRVVRYYQECGDIAEICTALAFGLASSARMGIRQTNRTGRLLIRLLNHDLLIRLVYRGADPAADRAAVRGIYDALEEVLQDDYQYWLQRGAFETESGDIDLAKNFLDQARGMAPDDLNVRTEWSYMTLKRAASSARDPRAADDAARAFDELEEVIAKRGAGDYYAFHVYGSQGLAWATHPSVEPTLRYLTVY